MEPMTPEERLTKIENALQSLTENQARHDAAIRDLILVSRTFLESQKETAAQIQELRQEFRQELRQTQQALFEQQRSTEEKLHALIDTVDRIIRNQKP